MFKRFISISICIAFISSNFQRAYAEGISFDPLPEPGTMVSLSSGYTPVLIQGLKINPNNPLKLDFIIATGNDAGATNNRPYLKKESEKLIKYFFAALTLPEKDVWVNLSPYEKDRIVPKVTGDTEMGRDMLAQDYILKQLTASLIYPEKSLGKDFWNKVYSQASQRFGTTQIPVNTFNKVWIVADKASVYEVNDTVIVVDSHLKVMLDEDYVAMGQHKGPKIVHSIGSQVIRQIVLPALEKEVNEGKNFANLRQIFHSIILAKWYKETLNTALLNQVYSDKNKIAGLSYNNALIGNSQYIYQQYLKAYKKGVFNYIKEDIDATTKQPIPRKYFSGGVVARLHLLVYRFLTQALRIKFAHLIVGTLLLVSTYEAKAGIGYSAKSNENITGIISSNSVDQLKKEKNELKNHLTNSKEVFLFRFLALPMLSAFSLFAWSLVGVNKKDNNDNSDAAMKAEAQFDLRQATFFPSGLYSVNLAGINAEVSQNFESVLNLPFLPEGQGRYILMAVENVPVLIGRFSMESKTSDQMAFINQARQAIQPNRPGHAHKAIQNRKSPQILTLEFIPLSAYSPGIDRAVFEDLGNYYHEIKLRRLARPEGLQLHIERMQESAYRLALSRVPDLTALDAVKLEGQVLPFEQTLENQARKLGYSVNQDTKFVLQLGDTLDRSRYYITFNAGFQKGGDNILLLPVKTMPADLEPMMRMGRLSKKVIGFNITSPHKVSAIRYLNELDETARIPGAVEAILKQEDGSLKGYNYAGDGWAYWYTQFVGESLKAKKIVILGAGGAARTLVHSIFQAAIDAHITVYDRQERITDELIANQKAHNPPCDLRAVSKANLNDDISQADIVINLTGSGKGYDDQNPIAPDIDYKLLRGKVVVDANYRFQGERKLNEFLRRASEAKAKKVLNGLGFSVGSIAPDIQLFSGKKVNFEDLMKVATTSLADGGAGLQNTTENGSEAMLTPAQALEANLTPGLSQLLEEGGWIETRGKLLKRDKELVDKLAQGLEPSLIELLKTYERPAEPGHKAVVYNPEEISSIAKRLADNGVRIALRAKRGDDVKQLRVLLGGQYESARGLLEFLWAEKRGEELKVPIEGLRVLLSSLIESFPSEVREDPSKIKQLLTDDNGLIQRLVLFREVYGYLKEYAGIKNGALEFLKGDLFTSAYYIGRGSKISENAVKNIIELKETIGLVSAQSKLVKQQWLIAVYTMASRNKSALGAIQEYANAGVKWQESWSEALKVQYLIAVYNVASRDKSVAGVISGYENTGIKWHDDWSDELKVQYLIAVYKVAMEGQSAVDVIKGYEDAGIKWQDTWSDEIKVQFLTAVYSIAMYGKTAATVIQEYESAGIKWHEDWDDALKEQFLISVYVVAMKGQSVRGVIQEYENAGIKWHDDWDVLLKVRYLTAVYCVGVAGKSAVGVIQQYEDAGIKWKDTWSDELKTQYLTAVYVVAMKGKEESLKVILPLLSSRDSLENIERLRLSWRMVLLNYDSQEINTLMDLPSSIGDKVKALNTRVFKKHRERETLIIPIDDGDGSDAMMASKPFERGGIDFNASKINMTRQGSGIEIRFDPAMVAQFRQGNFDGIDPVITGITSIASIYSLLGLR